MSYIFQAKPTIYELREKLVVGKEVGWLASRYYDEMKPGDIVYFWRAGEKKYRGLYGWGEITSTGVFKDRKGLYRAAVITRKVFADNEPPLHINYTYFKDNQILQNMGLLQMAIGTNFRLKEDQETEINNLILEKLGTEWVPGYNN